MAEQLNSTNLAGQVKEDFLAYSMAVIVGRAIPNLYDGMKPVHRRILTAMKWLNLSPDGRFIKSARVEGEVMGKLHPHGSAYGGMVTLAAPWSNNVPFITGHGNWGSSTDGAAASRYTECKLSPFAWEALLSDSETWQTMPNYDGSLQEPAEFNVRVPAVLLNGQEGIAVGFATRLAPHSLRDVVEATKLACKFSWTEKEGREATAKARKILLPDFPTGCDIVKDEQLDLYAQTGSGNIRCRARHESSVQKRDGRAKDRPMVTFTNLPPGVNPEKLGEQVRDGLEKGRIENVAEVIDESDLSGDRVSIVAKPGTDIGLLVKQLYAYTDLDTKYSAKTLVIDGTRPTELSPVEVCQKWFKWRMDRLEVQFRHERDLKEARLEIVEGFLKAIKIIDKVIKIIRSSPSTKEALTTLVTDRALKFTPDQARAILDMRLRQLTGLDHSELEKEKESLEELLADLNDLIDQPTSRAVRLYKQMTELAKRHGKARSSNLIEPPDVLSVAQKTTARQPSTPKPRFLSVDMKKGVVTQAKGPRGAMVVDSKEKVVLITESGYLRKVSATFKGPIAAGYSAVVLAKREVEVAERKYLVVFTLEGQLKGMVLSGADLIKANSKGKSYLPEGATLVHFGEGSYAVPWASKRKKALTVDLNFRAGKPGSKGGKIAQIEEVAL